ncbi:hypothetical protein [Sulfurirhabdus autotrophica]|uniref:Uncharacterized protein n=1 Tax=Sulfurirhabdus autotrophica TaxID=1706046 RepID=A0A4R3Y8L0_9PROT|nr:hypothetical protein [Sulfurirhabdus autotrophica]TCV86643.1 hypothetical protein EDC63_1064 [Sulfurirhabdus autotrophica]
MKNWFLALLISTLAGCATFPKSPDDQAMYYADKIEQQYKSGNPLDACLNMTSALAQPSGKAQIKSFLAKNPIYVKQLEDSLLNRARALTSKYEAFDVLNTTREISDAGIWRSSSSNAIVSELNASISKSNVTNSLDWMLGDDYSKFTSLSSTEGEDLIFHRTLNILKDTKRVPRQVNALLKFVESKGRNSSQFTEVFNALPQLNIKRSELTDEFSRIFPAFTQERLANLSLKIKLHCQPQDRLLQEDIAAKLKGLSNNFIIVPELDSDTVDVVVEKLRHDERAIPERTQTVTVSDTEVDLLKAALLMPRNASYLYDYTSGGANLEYGYAIKASRKGGVLADELIRDKLSNTYHSCSNMRVQNVFGGVQGAKFYANDDVRAKCSGSNQNNGGVEKLRQDLIDIIARKIADIPLLAKTRDLN